MLLSILGVEMIRFSNQKWRMSFMKSFYEFKKLCVAFLMGMLIFSLSGCGGSGNSQVQGYPIDTDVQTTVKRTVAPGPTPTPSEPPINLYDLSLYEAKGYGTWTFDTTGLPSDLRADPATFGIMQAGYVVPALPPKAKLLNFFTISDIHITDKESPNQLIYLQRLWPTKPIGASLYSGSMLYTTHVLDAAVQTVNALHNKDNKANPFDFGLSLGDTCNSTQYNELRWYIDVLDGKVITPSSGAHVGADTIDYQKPYQAAGLDKSIPWYQTLGNHDHFWMGSIPVDYSLRTDLRQSYITDEIFATSNLFLDFTTINDHVYYMGVLDGSTPYGNIIKAGKVGDPGFTSPPKVVADPDRRSLLRTEWMNEFFNTSSSPVGHGFNPTDANTGFACYSFVPKSTIPIKVIVLDDTQKEDDNSTDVHGHGFLNSTRWAWLKKELAAGDAAGQLMIIAAHIPINVELTEDTPKGEMGWWLDPQNAVTLPNLIAELQSHPNLLMWLSGHRHLNTVKAFISPDPVNHPEYGFWQVETPSLRDFPQQFRTFEIYLNSDYTISIVTTDVDPAVKAGTPAATSRKYAIAAEQIVGTWDLITNSNPTGDITIKPMPSGSYNATLYKQLSAAMKAKMQTLYP
jgi:metallophosphoesterase (TIGR03768 family)